jgi:hypothetical protein
MSELGSSSGCGLTFFEAYSMPTILTQEERIATIQKWFNILSNGASGLYERALALLIHQEILEASLKPSKSLSYNHYSLSDDSS